MLRALREMTELKFLGKLELEVAIEKLMLRKHSTVFDMIQMEKRMQASHRIQGI